MKPPSSYKPPKFTHKVPVLSHANSQYERLDQFSYLSTPSVNEWQPRHSPNKHHLPVARWMDVGSGGQCITLLSDNQDSVCDPDALVNTFAATNTWTCGTSRKMSHTVNSGPQTTLERNYSNCILLPHWMAEDIRLVHALNNNNNVSRQRQIVLVSDKRGETSTTYIMSCPRPKCRPLLLLIATN